MGAPAAEVMTTPKVIKFVAGTCAFAASGFVLSWAWGLGVPERMLVVGSAGALLGLWLIGPEVTRVLVGKALLVAGTVVLALGAFVQWGLPALVDEARTAVSTGVEKVVEKSTPDPVGWLKERLDR